MNDAAAELGDARERRLHVVDLEVGQRERVAGPLSALVNAERHVTVARLPACALAVAARLELDAQQPAPEPPRALRVVGGELDQRQRDSGESVTTPP